MKKAEIIKNGNVNLKTVKLDKKVNKEIDWDEVFKDYREWISEYTSVDNCLPLPNQCFKWIEERLS